MQENILQQPAFADVSPFLFALVSLILVATSFGVVLSSRVVVSVLFLVLHMLGVAAMFAVLGATFLATIQIALYAGAVVVLFLFVVMLLNIKAEDLGATSNVFRLSTIVLGLIVGAFLIPAVAPQFSRVLEPLNPANTTVIQMGKELFSKHVFIFEASSLVLLSAMVGAIMLSKRRSRQTEDSEASTPSR